MGRPFQKLNVDQFWCVWDTEERASFLLLQTYLLLLWPNSSSDHKTFHQKAFGLFIWVWRCWFWSKGFFLDQHTLSLSDVRLGSMWTVMLVYQHFPVYGRFKLWLVPGCFWTSKPMSSHLRMKVWVFFQTLELIILKSAVRNGFKDLPNYSSSS